MAALFFLVSTGFTITSKVNTNNSLGDTCWVCGAVGCTEAGSVMGQDNCTNFPMEGGDCDIYDTFCNIIPM